MKNRRALVVILSVSFMTFIVFGAIWGQQHPTISIHEKQLTFLKEHEADMTQFIKAQNSKIESVQFDWDSVETEYVGNGTPQGGGKVLTIEGKFNNIPNSNFCLQFNIDTADKMPDIKNMTAGNSFRIGGLLYE